ncbi:MAG: hypothetical protein GX945_03735 [Lentisphaerae bacterium]|nr:hypothetical protein [Lentisphaerota bacterium]
MLRVMYVMAISVKFGLRSLICQYISAQAVVVNFLGRAVLYPQISQFFLTRRREVFYPQITQIFGGLFFLSADFADCRRLWRPVLPLRGNSRRRVCFLSHTTARRFQEFPALANQSPGVKVSFPAVPGVPVV